MRRQGLIFTFLCGLLLVSSSRCSGGDAASNTSKGGGDLVSSRAWLDNYSPQPCAVAVDGEKKGTLAPFASLHLEVAPGAHTFVLTCEGQPATTLKAGIPADKNALVRAAAVSECVLLTYSLTDSPSPSNSVVERLKRLEPSKAEPAVSDLLIQALGRLAHQEAPEELRRGVVVLGLQQPVKGILNAACAVLADKDFVPNEKMAEALTATIDKLNPDEGDNQATIKHCSSCLVDAFYRHPAVVARPATRRFLARFAHPQLAPTLENARYALIDGMCAGDLAPIFTHFDRDTRIEMIGRLVKACRKREAVGQDAIELHRAALENEDTEVRITAAKALPQLAAFLTDDTLPAFQDLLGRALNDPSVDVQREAARALEVKGFLPTEQLADQVVAVWRQLDGTDSSGKTNREQLAKSLKSSFEKNPGGETDRSWRQRILAAFAQQ